MDQASYELAQEGAVLVLAPMGRDAAIAVAILHEAGIAAIACADVAALRRELDRADAAVLIEEAVATADLREVSSWIAAQPPWSDLPFVLLSHRGGGLERNPEARRLSSVLGNLAFLERPFHPTTLVSVVRSALAARRRQRQARDAIAAEATAAERLRFALRAGRLGSWELDVDTWEFRPSDACKAVFGRTPSDAFDYADLLAAIHSDDRAPVRDAVAAALAEGGDYHVEYRTVWPDGSVHWAELRGRVAENADGRRRMVGIALDTTERRAAEDELRLHRIRLEELVAIRTRELEASNQRLREAAKKRDRAEAALLQAQKMEAIGQLTGGLAHDFNNMLAGISGSLELLQTRLAEGRIEQLGRHIEMAQSGAQRAAALTHRLLAFSRRQTLDPKPTGLNHLVAGMADLIRSTVGPQIVTEIVYQDGLWLTLCDPHQLENGLLNLCINARDAMPQGGRLMIETGNTKIGSSAAAALQEARPGEYVTLCVTDTGTGMPPEVVARVFDPFFTTKPLGQGTGLGLSMIYGFLQQSGGHIEMSSEVGQGTRVRLYLPRYEGEVVAAAVGGARTATPEPAAQETVLVVDDEPDVRTVVTEVLADVGYQLLEASNGSSALELLQSSARIDLLVTDVGMPGMNGRQLANAAKELRPNLKVLFITGYAEAKLSEDRLLDPGMQVMTKPFALKELTAKVRATLA